MVKLAYKNDEIVTQVHSFNYYLINTIEFHYDLDDEVSISKQVLNNITLKKVC